MSEYQYYEFRTTGRRLSPRVQLTDSSAIFVYNYGDFRGDPEALVARYFDAMLYITNWVSRRLILRFPQNAIDKEVMQFYQYLEYVEWHPANEYVLVNIEFHDEAGGEWVEGNGLLSGIIPIHNDIMRGDYRALYLAWLMAAGYEHEMLEEDEDLVEPPVPPGLQSLTPALRNFIDFFRLDPDLVTAAARQSANTSQLEEDLSIYLEELPPAEQLNFLQRLLQGEAFLEFALAKRLREISGSHHRQPEALKAPTGEHRQTISQLLEAAEQISRERREEARRQAEAAHLKRLEGIAGNQAALWARLPGLIEQRKASAYDEAVSILVDLRDLAVHDKRLSEFRDKVGELRQRYPTLTSLHRRFRDAGLI